MPFSTKCGAFATLLALTSSALIIAATIIPEFVDAFVVVDAEDPTGGQPVARVGIFTSVYDSSVLSAEVIASSGVPDDKFETPTVEFPLLFPSQENFVVDVLPVSAEEVAAIDEALGDIVQASVDGVAAVEFESCEQYVDEVLPAIDVYFTLIEDFVFAAQLGAFGLAIPEPANLSDPIDIGVGIDFTFPELLLFQADLLDNGDLETLGNLYTLCLASFAANAQVGVTVDSCAPVFSRVVLDGAFQGDLALEDNLGLVFETTGVERALESCEDTVVDKEKIEQSNVAVIFSVVMHGLALLIGIAGMILSSYQLPLFSVAGIFSILGGGLTLAALLIVASAPVYDGVGDEAEVDEVFFTDGTVVKLATADFIIMIGAGVSYIVAACLARAGDSSDEEEEKKEVKEVKAAAPVDDPMEVEADEKLPAI